MEDKPVTKRSRFDQTEPEPRKASRFDRRSRSPSARKPDSARERSPLRDSAASPGSAKSPVDAAAAAAAAAAKINATLQARKGIQHVDVPPILTAQSSETAASASTFKSTTDTINGDMYIADGDYIKDIEVNDLRNRYTLTKSSTQKMIKEETGADVTTRGSYLPDKNMASATNPPLYLHVTSTTKEGLEKAVAKIEEMMAQDLPQLVDERRFRRREPDPVERDEFGRRKWPEEKITINLEPVPGFNLRAQIVGAGGAYVKHIQQETGCRVQIKGRGSGYIENATGREMDEEMFLHVAGPDPREVQHAKELCEDLLANVKEQYEEFKTRPPREFGGQRGYGDRYGGGGGGGGGGSNSYQQNDSYSQQGPGSAAGGQGAGDTAQATADQYAAYAQYYAQNPSQDPYAAYGGYAAYMQYYQQYYAAAQAAQQQGSPAPGASSAAPPPPPAEAAPPPPPPPSNPAPPPPPPGVSGYSSVPPPPGL